MDLVTGVIDTNICDYHVTIFCNRTHHHSRFTLQPDAQGQCELNVTEWDTRERKTLQNYLQKHRIRYHLHRIFRSCEEDD